MPWHISDFHEVKFNQDDNGWLTVFGIHRAIRERAEATQHSLMADYDADFDLALYLGDPDGDVDRVYLKDVLEQFYTDIDRLVDGDAGIRWTETSMRSDLWAMASLTTDIGLGDFADLLTRAANPLSFMWLQAALDRLTHFRVQIIPTAVGGTEYRSDTETTRQVAWDGRLTNSFAQNDATALWSMGSVGASWRATVQDPGVNRFDATAYSGVVADGEYRILKQNDSLIDIDFEISPWDGSTYADVMVTSASGTEDIFWDAVEMDLSTTHDVLLDFVSNPTTVPFSSADSAQMNIQYAILYIDLESILTDQ